MLDLVWILSCGLVATTGMTLFLVGLRRLRVSNTGFIQALGQVLTKDQSQWFRTGLGAHYLLGSFFSFIYAIIISMIPNLTSERIFLAAIGIGFFHSLAFGFLVAVLFSTGHPKNYVKTKSPLFVFSSLASHFIYSAILGFLFSLGTSGTNVRLATLFSF